MTLEQLRTFLWVARLGGVRKAAEQMHLSQPAVSARLAELEASLRVQLFSRSPRGVTLTKKGELLRGYAEQMFFVHEEILQHVANPAESEGLFRIGASETIAQSWLPQFLEKLSSAYPRVLLDLSVDISINLRDALLARRLDLALLMGPISDFNVENLTLPPVDLRWYQRAGSGVVDLARTPVVSFARDTRPYREIKAELSHRYGPTARVYSSASLSTNMQMVMVGIGVGPFPEHFAKAQIATGQIEEFDPGWRPRPLVFTASYLTEPRSALTECCARIARDVADAASEK